MINTQTKRTRTQRAVENGITILKTAIVQETSLSEASRLNSFGRNYLSDVSLRLKTNYKNKNVDKTTYQRFKKFLSFYKSL